MHKQTGVDRSAGTPTLQFDQVSFQYETGRKQSPVSIFKGISLTVTQQEFVCLLGPSGSGKSTFFRLVTGLEQPQSGLISLLGEVTENRLGKVGYMPQQDMLMPWRTIWQNAALPLELQGISKKEARQMVLALLESFGLAGYEDKYPAELSGGMRQRVSFLRATLTDAPLLLLDEPFSALDALTRLNMQEWLLDTWSSWHKTIIFITHDVEEALFLADRILLFSEKPVTEITEIAVPIPRPRQITDIYQPELVKLKQTLIERLRARVAVHE
jgi:putative hydroxymethylpyrimidine transport system ATP-binding protein